MTAAVLSFALPVISSAKCTLLKSEKLIFSFKTTKHSKSLCLLMDKNERYMIYRFKKGDRMELAYPSKKKNSLSFFEYSSYFRGGGAGNIGMELNELSFINGAFKYTIYDNYYAAEESIDIGIRVTKLGNGEEVADIKGDPATREGSLSLLKETVVKKVPLREQ